MVGGYSYAPNIGMWSSVSPAGTRSMPTIRSIPAWEHFEEGRPRGRYAGGDGQLLRVSRRLPRRLERRDRQGVLPQDFRARAPPGSSGGVKQGRTERAEIEAAYEVLINPAKRAAYDRSLEAGDE